MPRFLVTVVCVLSAVASDVAGQERTPAEVPGAKVLFDFEDPGDASAWTDTQMPEVKEKQPPVKAELSTERVTRGRHSLKLTFDGGQWPAVVTSKIPVATDWSEFQTLTADVTVTRPCVVGFRVTQEKSAADPADGERTRWNKTFFLLPGTNEVEALVHDRGYAVNRKFGAVATFTIMMYQPEKGESLHVDNVRLSPEKPQPRSTELWSPHSLGGFSMAGKRDWLKTGRLPQFKVLGTDWTVASVAELGKKLEAQWKQPEFRTIDEVDAAFKARYEALKAQHPKAVLAVLRDGEKGYDPARPDEVYAGWLDTHISSHGPDGPNDWRERSHGKHASVEAFMRHRSLLAKVDLSSIPRGSEVLAAELVLTRVLASDLQPPKKPHMWVAEPCTRPWVEDEVNCYEYAKGKYWKAHSGCYYGDDPDFLPLFVAYGPAQGQVSVWDFTEAVRSWTDGAHENHGFFFHCDSNDYMRVLTREVKEISQRPAVMVIYVPK